MVTDNEQAGSASVETLLPGDSESFLKQMRQRLDRSVTNEATERQKGQDDIKFINGEQWEQTTKDQRGKGRLCLTFNKMPTFLDQVDGDIRQNVPSVKVKAVDNDADPDAADVIEGLVRYTQRSSAADRIHSYAGIHAAAGGRGAWRVLTDYVDDNSFDQEISLKRILNAYSVYFDPAAEQNNKQDGEYFFIITEMSREEYKEQYGNNPVDFSVDGSEFDNWQTEATVRVAEYFYKEREPDKTLYLLADGSVSSDKPEGESAVQTRKVASHKIKWAKVDGKRVLETGDIPGTMFPVILIWGKQLCVGNKVESRGIARHAKDAQRLYNYFRTNDAEAAALQPKQPYLIPDVCLNETIVKFWDKANEENFPYLPYKTDPNNPGLKPFRLPPASPAPANQVQIQMADNEMRDTVGIQKAALGKESNETSGIAIQRRKQESDTGQYAFLDNLAEGIRTEGQIIVGMIPEIYDTEKQIRILGADMKEKIVSVNDGAGIDLTVGKYDVDISTEGSYSTQREEFQDKLAGIMPHMAPEQVGVISDIVFEMMDFSRADDIAARLKKLIPPEILEADESGDTMAQGDGEGMPGEEGMVLSPEQHAQMQMEQQAQAEQQMRMDQQVQAMEAEAQKQQIQAQEAQVKLDISQIKLEQEQVKLDGLRIDNEFKVKVGEDDIRALVQEVVTGGAQAPEVI